jgi:hypothetical protein
MRLRDKGLILCLIEYLEMHEITQIAMLNKSYRNTMCNSCTFIWKSAYRNVNLAHQEKELELQRQISLKTQEIKSIIPFKDFDVLGVSDGENEFDLRKLLQMYVCDDTRVGEWIQNTMYNTKIFLNKQYDFMQKLFLKEQERVRKEREMQQKQSQGQTNMLKQTNKKIKLFEIENKEYKEIFSELSDYISVVRKTQEH